MGLEINRTTTININPLQNIQAEFRIKRLPMVNLTSQKTAIPGVSMRSATQDTPLMGVPQSGDRLYFDELSVEFLVDSQLSNWSSIFKWMLGLGFPDNNEEYAVLASKGLRGPHGVQSDITQVLLDGQQNAFMEIRYTDCMPISLSQIDLDVTKTESSFVTARALFIYTDYHIVPVS